MQQQVACAIEVSRSLKARSQRLGPEWEEGKTADRVNSRVQFIGSDLVFEAQNRQATHFADDPLVLGVDIARGGNANTVMRFRRGADAATLPPIRLSGAQSRDSMSVASKLADVMSHSWNGRKIDVAFIDSGFGGPIVDRLRQLGYRNVIEVRFGLSPPDNRHFLNMRAWMWGKVKDWLAFGAIAKDALLETDLTGPGYYHDKSDRLVLESKEDMERRGLASPASPDDGDALVLTFVAAVPPKKPAYQPLPQPSGDRSWMT